MVGVGVGCCVLGEAALGAGCWFAVDDGGGGKLLIGSLVCLSVHHPTMTITHHSPHSPFATNTMRMMDERDLDRETMNRSGTLSRYYSINDGKEQTKVEEWQRGKGSTREHCI
jgi:hypothetical protein